MYAEEYAGEEEYESFLKHLIVVLWAGGYPHEIICFMLRHLLIDESENDHWSPFKIEKELSSIPLSELIKAVKNQYTCQSKLPFEVIDSAFFKIELLMRVKLYDIIKPADKNARNRWKEFLHMNVGETTLKHYFGSDPIQSINYWTFSVKRRLLRFFFEGKWKDRSVVDLSIYLKAMWFQELERDI